MTSTTTTSTATPTTTSTITVSVAGADLHVRRTGAGDPLVLIHGAWGDADSWTPVVAPLAEHFEVITYDRRGHTRSTDGDGPGGRHQDGRDLAAVIEALGRGPAHLVGNSAGASIALTAAVMHPDLVASAMAHEPAVGSLVRGHRDDELARVAAATAADMDVVRELLAAGDDEGGLRYFMDNVALGPGALDQFPPQRRAAFLANAHTFLDDLADPDLETIEVADLAACTVPILLTRGTASPLVEIAGVDVLAELVPNAHVRVLDGAGHVPYITHPQLFVETVVEFTSAVTTRTDQP